MSKQVHVKCRAEAYAHKKLARKGWGFLLGCSRLLWLCHVCQPPQPLLDTHIHFRKIEDTHGYRYFPLKAIQTKLSRWHLHLSKPSVCPFLLPEWSESSISLWSLLYSALLFSLFCWVCVYPSFRSHSNTLHTERDSIWLPVATEVRGNGIRPVISFDGNFIVTNYEGTRETEPLGQHLHAAC